jgi:LysM repeat protein
LREHLAQKTLDRLKVYSVTLHRTAAIVRTRFTRPSWLAVLAGIPSAPRHERMYRTSPFFATLGVVGILTIGQGIVLRPSDSAPPQPAATTPAQGRGPDSSSLAQPLSANLGPTDAELETDAASLIASVATESAEGTRSFKPVPTLTRYVVQPGDTVNAIAARHGISARTVTWVNRLANPNSIRPGQVLLVMSTDGTIHRTVEGDKPAAIAAAYGVTVDELVAANQLPDPGTLRPSEILMIPNAMRQQIEPPTPPAVRQPLAASEQDFISRLVAPAQESQRVTGVPASVTIAQAILETYWGTSFLAREANNYFGIKAHRRGGTDGVVWIDAWEVEDGKNVTRQEPFRKYMQVTDSLIDHGRFFHENARYAHALEARNDAREFARRINAAGYATDPGYSSKLIALMERYGLFQHDLL